MGGKVIIDRLSDGAIVARKVAPDEAGEEGLRHEAGVLRRLDIPGVVRLHEDSAEPGRHLDLVFVSGESLATSPARAATEVARLLAAVAHTLAEAHRRGLSHGRVDASHVLIAPDGEPVLCGWSSAGVSNADADADGDPDADADGVRAGLNAAFAAGADADPARNPNGRAFDPSGDVAAVGSLLAELLEAARKTSPAAPAAEQRRRTRLAALASAAQHPLLERRPTMAELAELLAQERAPAAEGVERSRSGHRAGEPTGLTTRALRRALPAGRRPRLARLPRPVLATAAAAVVAVAVTLAAGRGDRNDGLVVPAPLTESAAPAARSDAGAADWPPSAPPPPTSAPVAALAPERTPCPDTAEALAAQGLRAGCQDGVVIDGRTVQVGVALFELGDEGDVVALTEPGCRGWLTPAVLRPGSGELFVFDQWAGPAVPVAARLVGLYPSATSLRPASAQSCVGVEVVLADGDAVAVPSEVL